MMERMQPAGLRRPPFHGRISRLRFAWLLPVLIVGVALLLRLNGVGWDDGNLFHPDERSIYMRADCMYKTLTEHPGWKACANLDFPLDDPGFPSPGIFLNADRSPLNPHWFPLGTVLIYAMVLILGAYGLFVDGIGLSQLALVGRTLGAFADAGSVLMIFALGTRLYGRSTGLLAAGLSAFSVASIQLAHFYRPEPFVVLTTLCSFWFMLNVLGLNRLRDHVLLGVMIGLSFALKPTSLPLLIPLVITYVILAKRAWDFYRQMIPAIAVLEVGAQALTAALLALVIFAALQPYAFLDFAKFSADIAWEADIARTAGLVPYTLQYVGAPTGWYELRQTTLWALGLPLGVIAWIGLVLTLIRSLSRPRTGDLLFLAWVIPTLVTLAFFEVKFLRYISVVLPIVVLLGSRWLIWAYQWAVPRSITLSRIVLVFSTLVVLATIFYGLAFTRMYNNPHPAVQASLWINTNVPGGSPILTDNHWDEGFPNLGGYDVQQLPMYEQDRYEKIELVSSRLAKADYLMSYSNRPFGSITRLPERYPLSRSYYQLLFEGELGYELERAFANFPSLLGVSFAHDPFTRAEVRTPDVLPGIETGRLVLDLGYADENITNYDHPLVLVFRNVERLTTADILNRIISHRPVKPPEGLMLSKESWATQRAGGTWVELFNDSGLSAKLPWLIWLLLIEGIALIALPLTVTAFQWLPDRGVVFARILGLLIVSWLTWLGSSIGWWTFSRTSVSFGILVLAIASALAFYRQRTLMLALVRRHWRYLVSTEVLFLLAFFAFLAIRAANPDLWHPWRGGEKPMELSYLTAIVKSTTMPPFDPWYAGGYLNYYYFGHFIVATLIKFSGIVPTIAYNLAIPLLFAFTVTGAYSIGYNLAEFLRRNRFPQRSSNSVMFTGFAAALLVVVAGNLDGAGQILHGTWLWITESTFPAFDYWRSSRLIPDQISITEFPFWSFLFADLHAHVIALPFTILTVALALNLALSGARRIRWTERVLAGSLLAFTLGALAAINTWDIPAFASIGLVALFVLIASTAKTFGLTQWIQWLACGAFLWMVGYVLFLPFHDSYDMPFGGLQFSHWRTPLLHYLQIHGLMFFIISSWLILEGYRQLGPWLRSSGSSDSESIPTGPMRLLSGIPVTGRSLMLTVTALIAASLIATEFSTVGPLMFLLLVAVLLFFSRMLHLYRADAPGQLFLLAMMGIGLGIGIGVDVITVENDIDRMNTMFKLYMNAWVLLGLSAAVALWLLLAPSNAPVRRHRSLGSKTWMVLLGLLVLSSAIFPALGTRARLADRFHQTSLTLDGAAYQAAAVYTDPGPSSTRSDVEKQYALKGDAEALEYMRRAVRGSPVVLEAITTQYRWTPRVAKYTGLPVVIGWEWHQLQQRGEANAFVSQRIRDVNRIYTTTDLAETMSLLGKYEIEYIYVGPVERIYYPELGLRKFASMKEIKPFFQNEEVTIYRIFPLAD